MDGDRTAAMLAGSTFAFNTHAPTRIPHVEARAIGIRGRTTTHRS